MKKYFKKYKYLHHSVSLFMVILIMLGFDSDSIKLFFFNLGKVFSYAAAAGLSIYLTTMFLGWILWPAIPKHEDFENNEERKKYFEYETESKDLLWLYIYFIIAFVIVFTLRG